MSNTSRKKQSFFPELKNVSTLNNKRHISDNEINIPGENSHLLQEIITNMPALIAVYNIQTGKYIFVNNAVTTLLGYSKEQILTEGSSFIASHVHPEDLERISRENQKALRVANSKKFPRNNDKLPVTFEYRMKHKNGSWVWLHSDGIIFSRDKSGIVEYVMNVSVDITGHKEKEQLDKELKEKAEKERNLMLQQQLRSISLRAEISDILRKDCDLTELFRDYLKSIVSNLNAIVAAIWLYDEQTQMVRITASEGSAPPKKTIIPQVKIGQFAVGKVVKRNKVIITNNVYEDNNVLLQNPEWAKKKKFKSFAGLPLYFKNKMIGVLTIYSSLEINQNEIDSLTSVADILAQEITRKQLETQLIESRQRYFNFMQQSSEGIWRIQLEKSVSTSMDPKKQINHFYKYAYMAECNEAMANMYGYSSPDLLIGKRLGELLIKSDPTNIEYLTAFIQSKYSLSGTESAEKDKYGNIKYFLNSLVGFVENGNLTHAWGIQQDITERKKYERQILSLSQQKDEFIAIASHELKTPVTTLKAFTQILERRCEKLKEKEPLQFLNKMDLQINKLTALIADLLDVSKIEAGKLQFSMKKFDVNELIKEVAEEMQRTTQKHQIILKLDETIVIQADKERIEQVLINLISNAIKYSPDANKVVIKTTLKDNEIKVSIQDFGIGISKEEQQKIFERFYRTENPNQQSYAGLGLGLYISSEIIRRHSGRIKVKSQKGKGSTFKFTLPIKTSPIV